MYRIEPCRNVNQLYRYQQALDYPYNFPASFEAWSESMFHDVNGDGQMLFQKLCTKAAYSGEQILGFVQYGLTACGFDDSGALSTAVSYPVIRMLYFDDAAVGEALLDTALRDLPADTTVYAFFHYFGLSCSARHGKLQENYSQVAALLKEHGFEIEHENVYYTRDLSASAPSAVTLSLKEVSPGGQQMGQFYMDDHLIGECELHYVKPQEIVYLRWFFIHDTLRHRGVGSECMRRLIQYLYTQNYKRLDTDTADTNETAQHFYEKNDFRRMGITRSYYKKAETSSMK